MTWDVLLMQVPPGMTDVAELPDDYQLPQLGNRVRVAAAVIAAAGGTTWDSAPRLGAFEGAGWRLDIDLGPNDPTDCVEIRATRSDPAVAAVVRRIAAAVGCRAVDCESGQVLLPGRAIKRGAHRAPEPEPSTAEPRRAIERPAPDPLRTSAPQRAGEPVAGSANRFYREKFRHN